MTSKNIDMVRGDTLAFAFEYDGTTQDLDSAYFTCKQDLDNTEPLFQKSLSDGISKVATTETGVQYRVRVDPDDTINLSPGIYYYDLQIELNSDIYTILRGSLKIYADVTREV